MRPKCSVPDRSTPSVVTLPTLARIGLPPMMEVITGVGLIASKRFLKSTWYRSIWPSKAVIGAEVELVAAAQARLVGDRAFPA